MTDVTSIVAQRRLPNKSFISILTRVMVKLLAWVYIVVPGVSKLFKKNDDENVLDNQQRLEHVDSSSNSSEAKIVEHHPCWQRLQHLENVVTELVNKPVKIPPEKDDILLESMNRIKGIEYDLQKTKKVIMLL